MLAGSEQLLLQAIRQLDHPAPTRAQRDEDRRPQSHTGRNEGSHRRPLPWLPDPHQPAQDHAQVVRHDGDELLPGDLDQTKDPRTSRATCCAHMREAAFDDLGSASLQLLALLETGAPTILVHRFLPAFGLVVLATLPLVATRRDVATGGSIGHSSHFMPQCLHCIAATASLRARPVASNDIPPVMSAPVALPPEIPRFLSTRLTNTWPEVPQCLQTTFGCKPAARSRNEGELDDAARGETHQAATNAIKRAIKPKFEMDPVASS